MKILTVAGVLFVFAGVSSNSAWCADAPANPDRMIGASVDYSVVDKGDVRFRGTQSQMSETHMISPTVFARIPVNDSWFVPVGVSSEHVFLDSVTGAPVPERINTLRLSTGLGYRISPEWTVEAAAGPLFYNLEHLDGGTIGFGGLIRGTWKPRPDFMVVAGLAISPDSEVPVFPAAGAIWEVSTNVTLNLVAPKPRVIYHVTPWVNVYAGAEVRFTIFRTGSDIEDRTGVAGFNRALGTYRDIHLGGGAEFKLVDGLLAGFEAGYSVGRLIDYTRIDERVRFESAPYVHVGVRYQF